MRHFSFFLLMFSFLLLSVNLVQAEEKKVIKAVEYIAQSETNGVVIIEIADNNVTPVLSQIGGKSPRIVLDFKETRYRTSNKVNIDQPALASSIRFGLHNKPLKTRMVIDLSGSCKLKKPEVKRVEKGFEVDLQCQENKEAISLPKDVVGDKKSQVSVAEEVAEEKQEKAVEEKAEVKPAKDLATVIPDVNKPVSGKNVEKAAEEAVETLILEPEEGAVVSSSAKEEKQFDLSEIAFSRLEEKDEEVVLFYLDGFNPPVVSAVEKDILQVVCEFKNTTLSSGVHRLIETYGIYIKEITSSVQEGDGSLKVVLDLAADNDYDLQQTFYKNDNVFSLVITKAKQSTEQ